MKIYTKAGDTGETYLASGKKVPKTDERVGLYGTSDELNSWIGFALSFRPQSGSGVIEYLTKVQHLLFELGSELAGYQAKSGVSCIGPEDTQEMENEIDRLSQSLPELKSFILPAGVSFASGLHIARTISRRLERETLTYIQNGGDISQEIRIFLNRLSDYLFTAARYVNMESKEKEVEWRSRTK
ncbi:ATP:cob(I)alamin adenosyltransferase [Leptospira ryugenii]|uniref:Corrinoid adenosyltransferase n=1 Tax=Leptospira ryugenii TaxID=1917863 RepID=A0A2P2DX94_9LEPT|nr:cob(I)yrinic acid a,c-diamide adenosyltransferase [Leptospira ryugenii]GBF49257.1 ATP:cob(I)alamin adenosyltransferase [Leptospira ryugenii]